MDALMVVATIPVTDLDRAKRFYQEVLGLNVHWPHRADRTSPGRLVPRP
jgi:catechol 2,3-dioxygenase-like lactoylglutathione lyase family enzyme